MWWNFNEIQCGNSSKQASRPTGYFSPPNTLIPLFYYFLYDGPIRIYPVTENHIGSAFGKIKTNRQTYQQTSL